MSELAYAEGGAYISIEVNYGTTMLTGKQKRALRARGNRLRCELWIGKDGISDGTLASLNNSFNTKELVKVKLQESCPLDKREAADILTRKSQAQLIQILGRTVLLYRPLIDDL